jgi:hypothetical protein
MEVSGKLSAPVALPTGEERLVPIVEEAGWAPEPVWTLYSTRKSHVHPGNRNPAVQRAAMPTPTLCACICIIVYDNLTRN